MQNSLNDLFQDNLPSIQEFDDIEDNKLDFLTSYNALKLSFNELNISNNDIHSFRDFDSMLKKRQSIKDLDKEFSKENRQLQETIFKPFLAKKVKKQRPPSIAKKTKSNFKGHGLFLNTETPKFSFSEESEEQGCSVKTKKLSSKYIQSIKSQKPIRYNYIKTKPLVTCNCKKSKCLKMYCKCFSKGLVCGIDCNCVDCFNSEEHKDIRQKIVDEILLKNPKAFDYKFKKHLKNNELVNSRGCNCSKTGCVKEYCRCYKEGTGCTTLCRCTDCKNKKIELKPEEVKLYFERASRKRSKVNMFEKFFGNRDDSP